MSSFDDRKKSYESKFAHDAEARFRAEARRNRLLGEWAADIMGKTGDDKAAYAKEVVKADFEEAGDEDVFRKVNGDLGGKVSEQEIRTKMSELMETAKEQVANED